MISNLAEISAALLLSHDLVNFALQKDVSRDSCFMTCSTPRGLVICATEPISDNITISFQDDLFIETRADF
jgi:hypothetical protein